MEYQTHFVDELLTGGDVPPKICPTMGPSQVRLKAHGLSVIVTLAAVTACSSSRREYLGDNAAGGTPEGATTLGGTTGTSTSRGGSSGTNVAKGGSSNASGGAATVGGGGSQAPEGGATATGSSLVSPLGGASTTTSGTSGGTARGGAATGGAATGGAATGGAATGGAATGGATATSLSDGSSCVASAECASRNCIDGVCCKIACIGCNACSNALTGQANGTCAPALVGKDPHNTCAIETATNQCGNDGSCDGKGACQKVSSSHVCTAGVCSADGKTYTPATTCNSNGSGTCTAAAAQDCAGYPCTATGCSKPCSAQSECMTGNYCDLTTGKCTARKSNGSTATNTYECTSGHIADGVCCDTACTGQCQSCKQTAGTCKAVTTPRSPCGGTGTCGTKKCDGASAECVFPGSEVACPASCSSDLLATLTSTCSAGVCGTPKSTACGSFYYCATGQCSAKLPNSTAGCGSNVMCASGNCSTASSGAMCCAAGLSNCSQGCFDLKTDAKHCGSCAGDCGPNYNCNSSLCTCAGSKLSCGTCASWSFESGTTEGWIRSPWSTTAPVPTVQATPPNNPFSGTRSLAITLSQQTSGSFVIPLCPNVGTMTNVSGISYYVYQDGPSYAGTKGELVLGLLDDGTQVVGSSHSHSPNTWVKNELTFSGGGSANYITIQFSSQTEWTGTFYIDQISITP